MVSWWKEWIQQTEQELGWPRGRGCCNTGEEKLIKASLACLVQGEVLQPIRPSLWISTRKAENETNPKK